MSAGSPSVRRPRRAEQRVETLELILDTAKALFFQHGLYGVTLKEVAKRVGVHHTLLNGYFADKPALFDAVFSRRAVVTSERRMKALDDYEAAYGGVPTVEGALHALSGYQPRSLHRRRRTVSQLYEAGCTGGQHPRMGRRADGCAHADRTDRQIRSADVVSVKQHMAPFMAAGFLALCR